MMIVDSEEQLCYMVEECGMRGVVDTACSKTVGGKRYIRIYIAHIPAHERSLVKNCEPSETIYQFGGGERRASIETLQIPVNIGGLKIMIKTEVVDADIPLLIGANYLEISRAVLDFGKLEAKIFSVNVPLVKVSSGITLHPSEDSSAPCESTSVLHEG